MGSDLMSFHFTITPPTPSECLINYTIAVNGSDGSSRAITVPAAQLSVPVGSVRPCSVSYTTTVASATIDRTGARSAPYSSGILFAIKP